MASNSKHSFQAVPDEISIENDGSNPCDAEASRESMKRFNFPVMEKLKEAGDSVYRYLLKKKDFKFYWMMYYIVISSTIGFTISGLDGITVVDGVFMAASGMTGAGLSTVPMYMISKPSLIMIAILMMIGCAPFMLMPTMIYRRYCFSRLNAEMDVLRQKKLLPRWKDLHPRERAIIDDHFQLDTALGVLTDIVVAYYILFLVMGVLILNAALHIRPLQAELAGRGISYLDNAAFLAVSAFANAGYTITSDNLIGLQDNPCAYLLLTWLIIAGNTALPIFLRIFITIILRFENNLIIVLYPRYDPNKPDELVESKRAKYRRTLQFILDNPRRLTTHLFSNLQTKVLASVVFSLILVQYIFFLGSTMNRPSATFNHSRATLAGIGYFQTLSTRAAGFSIMDLRELNQGLLLIYFVMMYVSSFPFISVLKGGSPKVVPDSTMQDSEEVEVIEEIKLEGKLQNSSLSQRKPVIGDAQQLSNPVEADTTRSRSSSASFDFSDEDKVKVEDINKKIATTYFLRHTFFLFVAILICAYSEDEMLSNPMIDVNLWYVAFEIISGYGNVGLSFGIPGQVYSLSGGMTAVGKCTIIFIMWLGKHRGLPTSKDEVVDFSFMKYRTACRYIADVEVVDKKIVQEPASQQVDDESSEIDQQHHRHHHHHHHIHHHKRPSRTTHEDTQYNPLVVKDVEP